MAYLEPADPTGPGNRYVYVLSFRNFKGGSGSLVQDLGNLFI